MKAELIQDVLEKCRASFLAVVLFSLCINLLMLVAPLYVLQIFDRVLSSESRETLLYLTLLAAVAFGLHRLDLAFPSGFLDSSVMYRTGPCGWAVRLWLGNALSSLAALVMRSSQSRDQRQMDHSDHSK